MVIVIALAALTTMAVVTTMTTQTASAQTDNCRPDGSDRTCSGGTGQPSIESGNRNSMTIDDTRLITGTTFTGSGDGSGRSTNEEGNTVPNGDGDGSGRSTNEEGNTVPNGDGDGSGRSTCDAFPTDCDFDHHNAINERGAGDTS
jgi:hypothetical protein